jgi:hypothetical protein
VLTAGKMMSSEGFYVDDFFANQQLLKWLLIALLMFSVLYVGWRKNQVKM